MKSAGTHSIRTVDVIMSIVKNTILLGNALIKGGDAYVRRRVSVSLFTHFLLYRGKTNREVIMALALLFLIVLTFLRMHDVF